MLTDNLLQEHVHGDSIDHFACLSPAVETTSRKYWHLHYFWAVQHRRQMQSVRDSDSTRMTYND